MTAATTTAEIGGRVKVVQVLHANMSPEVTLGRVRSLLAELEYPVTRVDAATELEPYQLVYAGGDVNLGGIVSETNSDAFDTPEELEDEVRELVPREALEEGGEPNR